jgi:hypothetical protein
MDYTLDKKCNHCGHRVKKGACDCLYKHLIPTKFSDPSISVYLAQIEQTYRRLRVDLLRFEEPVRTLRTITLTATSPFSMLQIFHSPNCLNFGENFL